MVPDQVYHLEGQYLRLDIARCLNCGHILDLTEGTLVRKPFDKDPGKVNAHRDPLVA